MQWGPAASPLPWGEAGPPAGRVRGGTFKIIVLRPSPCPSQQARLGVLATQNARVRKRIREGRGAVLPPAEFHSPPHAGARFCQSIL